MQEFKNLENLLVILIEREREEKEKHFNNWTVSEYAYHYGMESAYSIILKELRLNYLTIA